MNTKHWHLILVCTALVLLLGTAIQADAPPTPAPPPPPIHPLPPLAVKHKTPDLDLTAAGRRALTASGTAAIGTQIDIAVSDHRDAQDAAVALCGAGQYLVVFERDDAIYGQRLTSDGSLLGGAFQISSGTHEAINPDVACDWYYNRFVVVWQYYFGTSGDPPTPDYDIRAQGVYGKHNVSGSQLYGDEKWVAAESYGEYSPSIACNSDDHTCLVVFQDGGSGNGDIYGRRVAVGAVDITVPADSFSIGGSGNQDLNADVAWGGQENKFLVVWQYYDDDTDSYRIVFSQVWDTQQAGSQIADGATFLIGDTTSQLFPAVAYGYDSRDFLVVYQYDYYGTGGDYDVLGCRVNIADVPNVYATPIGYVGATSEFEGMPDVAYSAGPQNIADGMGANQFLVAYVYQSDVGRGIYVRPVKGHHAYTGSQFESDPAAIYTFGGPSFGLYDPALTGSINDGRYMAAWTHVTYDIANTDYDVLGQRVAPYGIYLPLVLRQ